MTDARDEGVPDDRIPGGIPWPRLAGPLVAAEDALARLDERLRASPLRDGLTARMHYADACASLWIEGELVPVEDLVLHDASADIRAPTPQLTRALSVLQARRLIADRQPDWALGHDGIAHLSGKISATPPPPGAGREASTDAGGLDDALSIIDTLLARTSQVLSGEAIASHAGAPPDPHASDPEAWRGAAGAVEHLPPLLAAGLLWDSWETRPPVPQRGWLGRQLVAAYLRERGKAAAHLPAVNAGLRTVPWERRRARDRTTRLLAWLEGARAGAHASLAEHDRLAVALAVLDRKCAARRATSRLADLVSLAAARPLVTVATAAQALGITGRAAQKLIAELGLREATGRGRYRAWML